MTQVTTDRLGRREPLGRGGTALVYRVPDLRLPELPGTALVYKEYKKKIRDLAGPALGPGLESLVRFRENLSGRHRAKWDEQIIWPTRLVVDGSGNATGIIMPLIPPRFFHDFVKRTGAIERKPREIDTLFGDPEALARAGLPAVDLLTRLRLIRRIALAYAMMHKQGIVLGDISGRNVLYDPDPRQPTIVVVDVDSSRKEGTRAPFALQPHTPNWEPPTALDANRRLQNSALAPTMSGSERARLRHAWSTQNRATDVYKFGLIVVRTLDPGRGATTNRNPANALRTLRRHLGINTADLLQRSLSRDDADRPTMRDWYLTLANGQDDTRTPPAAPPYTPWPGPSSSSSSGIPTGRRVGNLVWDGSGWVRQ
jgi:serine/threonine protein kinase